MPGTTTIPLYKSNGKYDNIVENYESVPLLYGEASDIKECLYIQKLISFYILSSARVQERVIVLVISRGNVILFII